MKHLTKIVTVGTALVLSLGSISAFAADMPANKIHKHKEQTSITVQAKSKRTEKIAFSEEEKVPKIEGMKSELAEKLTTGELTQEEYDDAIGKLESGDFKRGRVGKGKKDKKIECNDEESPERPEKVGMTEEEKTAKIEEIKAELAEKLSAGEITQEEYDEKIAEIESGKFKLGKHGKNMKHQMDKASEIDDSYDVAVSDETANGETDITE